MIYSVYYILHFLHDAYGRTHHNIYICIYMYIYNYTLCNLCGCSWHLGEPILCCSFLVRFLRGVSKRQTWVQLQPFNAALQHGWPSSTFLYKSLRGLVTEAGSPLHRAEAALLLSQDLGALARAVFALVVRYCEDCWQHWPRLDWLFVRVSAVALGCWSWFFFRSLRVPL